jgi:signal transduction histidine kinase
MATAISMEHSVAASKAVLEEDLMVEVRRGKLLYKLLIIFLSLSIVPLLVAGYLLIRVGDNYIQKQIIGVKLEIAQKVASSVTSYMDDKKNALQIVHKSSDFLAMNPRRQSEILGNVMNAYPMFMNMAVIDLNGREISSVNRMGRSSHSEEIQALKLIKSLGDYIGPVSRSPEGYPQITLGVPIESIPGRPIGVLIGVINLIDLSSLIKDLVIDKKGYVYIVDMGQKHLIAHPDIQTLLSDDPPPEVRAAELAPEETGSGAIEFTDQSKHRFLATYATVPRLNWRVFVQQPTEEAYAASKQMRNEIFKVLVVVILITLVLGVLISQVIVRRVQTLQRAMEQVGEGNFNVPEVPASNDEFGSLTEKFLWMANSLKDKTLKLVSAQKELQKWNSELERRVQERTRDLKGAQEQLIAQEKLAALGQMASVVGHELRNPLAVMNNSVYFLKTKLKSPSPLAGEGRDGGTVNGEANPPPQSRQTSGESPAVWRPPVPTRGEEANLDPKIQKHLNIIENEIVKSNVIISDVLDFARNRALNLASQNVDELVEKAIERIQLPPNITFKKDLQLGNLKVPLDEDEIRQVLVNLMENACQAMTSGGTLTVGTKSHTDQVEIFIADSGCGIPQEHLNKIFAPFFTTKSRGTGLGLAVVKKVIERHQGTITVKSKVGEGTAFHIYLLVRGPHV